MIFSTCHRLSIRNSILNSGAFAVSLFWGTLGTMHCSRSVLISLPSERSSMGGVRWACGGQSEGSPALRSQPAPRLGEREHMGIFENASSCIHIFKSQMIATHSQVETLPNLFLMEGLSCLVSLISFLPTHWVVTTPKFPNTKYEIFRYCSLNYPC